MNIRGEEERRQRSRATRDAQGGVQSGRISLFAARPAQVRSHEVFALAIENARRNFETVPFGSGLEVREEVADNLRLLGGGSIPAPCHNIQAVSPPQHIVAMYEAGYELEWT